MTGLGRREHNTANESGPTNISRKVALVNGRVEE